MISYYVFLKQDRKRIVEIINSVGAEGRFLQTGGYVPTTAWESLLEKGMDRGRGQFLAAARHGEKIVGFGRLFPDDPTGRPTGNVGIVLLPDYRYQRLGTRLLELLIEVAPEFGFTNLTADILLDNSVSLRLFRGNRFKEYSRKILYLEHRNAFVDEVRLQLLLTEGRRRDPCPTIQRLTGRLIGKTSEG